MLLFLAHRDIVY